eukprot:m.61031 g.61031  ORF g.61031 m.61031 type:complete len:70 (+) comp13868_c1_seq10:2199-2408(+)
MMCKIQSSVSVPINRQLHLAIYDSVSEYWARSSSTTASSANPYATKSDSSSGFWLYKMASSSAITSLAG